MNRMDRMMRQKVLCYCGRQTSIFCRPLWIEFPFLYILKSCFLAKNFRALHDLCLKSTFHRNLWARVYPSVFYSYIPYNSIVLYQSVLTNWDNSSRQTYHLLKARYSDTGHYNCTTENRVTTSRNRKIDYATVVVNIVGMLMNSMTKKWQ